MQDSAGIRNALPKTFLNQPLAKTEQIIPSVTFLFKGTTLDKKCALIMNRSSFLKRAYSSGTGIYLIKQCMKLS